MERPGFIEPPIPGPVEPVVVDLSTIAPGQFDPHNKFSRWQEGKVDFSKRDRIVSAERFKALQNAARTLAPSFDVQVAEDTIGPSAPTATGHFDSLDYTQCCGGGGNVPPDPELAAGPNHLIAVVNVALEVYDKFGAVMKPATTIESFMNANSNCTNVFDPNALYDEEADRFIVGVATRGGFYCAAVSQTGDPTGLWNVYAFQTVSGADFFDYPHAGVGRDAIYVGSNIFGAIQFSEARIFALDKAAMYNGLPAAYVSRGLGQSYDTPQPLNLHGSDQGTWPNSGPHYFFADKNYNGRTYAVFAWTDPFGSNSLVETGVVDLNAATGVTAGMPIDVPQSGGGTVDGGDWRPQDFEYRNGFGWTTTTIACNPGGGSVNCVRWAKIDLAAAAVADAGVFAGNDGTYRSYADVAANDCGDMAVGYTKSGAAMYPAVWYTGRIDTDPVGTLQPEAEVKAGEIAYTSFETGTPRRWGDYTGMTIDPDGQTFWYLGEYSKNTGTSSGRWGTYIGSFDFACDATPVPDTTPPVRASGQPSGTLAAGTTEAILSLTTDEAATCRYDTSAGTAYAAMTEVFGTTDGLTHQSTVLGLANGQTYHYFVRCEDVAGNANSDDFEIAFSVASGGSAASLHIADLDGSTSSSGKNWQALVTATVLDDNGGQPVDGATVYGIWSGDASGTGSCLTDGGGTCTVPSGSIPKKRTNSAVFTVTDISHASLGYDPSANGDPDGDSNGTAIQVNKDGTTQNPGNQPPIAGFGYAVSGLTVSFTDQSSDPDGTISSWSWNFGDGGTSNAQNPSHDYATDGAYSVSLTVTDDGGASGTDTQTVTVGNVTAIVAHVGDLDDSSSPARGSRWNASVTVTVHNASEGLVQGATVSGTWSAGANGSASCDTDASGQCALVKQNVKGSVGSVTLEITGITHATELLTYDAGANHDPDGPPADSDGTIITVSQP